jgi:hypothetical protein
MKSDGGTAWEQARNRQMANPHPLRSVATQFKPGQSGNPSGRPQGEAEFRAWLRDWCNGEEGKAHILARIKAAIGS